MNTRMSELNTQAFFMIDNWWKSMFLSSSELKDLKLKPAPSAYKAQLRRASTLEDIVMLDGFRALWFGLPQEWREQYREQRFELVALLAGILVYVKSNSEQRLSEAAGGQDLKNDKSRVSALRFSQLLESQNNEEFMRRMRRVLVLIDGTVNLRGLIEDLNQWFLEKNVFVDTPSARRINVRWALEYFKFAN